MLSQYTVNQKCKGTVAGDEILLQMSVNVIMFL